MHSESTVDTLAMITITALNEEYIAALLAGDADWYRDHITDDFVCIEPDGTILDKPAFLRDAARGPAAASFVVEDLHIRIYGTVAIVQAIGRFSCDNGVAGTNRYTDVYARVDGAWKAVTAHITRVAGEHATG
jgi:ketosteroid isomerase-like protein